MLLKSLSPPLSGTQADRAEHGLGQDALVNPVPDERGKEG